MNVYLETTGCRLNQSEIETIARQFRQAGHTIVGSAAEADLCVVNTCTVTREAARSSRTMIRRLNRDNPGAEIVATGCYAHVSPDAVESLPGVVRIVDNIDKDRLVPLVLISDTPLDIFDREPLDREFASGALGRTRAFVKVQDGCNNRCTFCVTTIARGPGRSRPLDDVVREIQVLAASGYQEAVLTGVHLGSYGHDRGERDGLAGLIRAILDQTDIPRLRLSSLEPWDLAPDFFSLWTDARLCRHLHLPLQSGCDATLRRMGRRTSQAAFGALVEAARAQIPDLAISTDLIAGFPGETDAEFEAGYEFVRVMDFMKLHVFRYSARAGTVAARMPGQVPADVKKARSARLLALSDEGARRFWARFVGRDVSVLWEQVTGVSAEGIFHNTGLTDHYIRVEMDAPRPLTNMITTVRADSAAYHGLRAALEFVLP
ncbi:MAG: tRNA (N(6)-L-threonylcarbamoyladenosine(37)-C(2))-methylthiotransferase MtaB [Anaerolineae bacterium]|nr:tRNA (N(6)-L-threonylcarbamoyladenosine(37)-C(2))-methylthiotransferase MtaB [Anaerolineae bacterium]